LQEIRTEIYICQQRIS